ncbi:extracellular solute-binding protein [Demequina sp.]|uniref:extracellular solute-binding protein n=1 Tax=Demequina sp. TaxID=2050685 RepID=UPI0025C1719B|nr:extracellular solute-binding protein [Demequina sp.]
MNHRKKAGASVVAVTAAAMLLASCSSGGGGTSSAGDGTGDVEVWAHQGKDSEVAALQDAVANFNASQSDITVNLTLVPEADYTTTIQSTSASDLPDVLELDGPTLANFVYDAKVAPIGDYVSQATIDNASAGNVNQGTVDGTLYALAQFNSGLGLCANGALLDDAGVTYPDSIDSAWTADEFRSALQTLAAANDSGYALDIKENYGLGGEWGTYAFSPLLQSAGGNLIADNEASGVIDGPESVSAMEAFQSWLPYVDPNEDDAAFVDGRVAISWCGHWMYPGYSEALGDDLVILPLPDMGTGTKSGAGSWTWGMGSTTGQGTAAGAFLDYLLNDQNVAAMTAANGAPPATKSVLASDALYSAGGPLELWGKQLEASCNADAITSDCVTVLRPLTAGYPVITSEFASALSAIATGGDVQSALTGAATAIDQSFADNNDYQ